MMRPFETQPTAVLHHVKKWEKKPAMMQPGEEVEWCFQTEVPSDYGPRMSLYVIGFVRYKDRLNFHQYVLFARRYDPLEGRFLPVKDNAPYENEN